MDDGLKNWVIILGLLCIILLIGNVSSCSTAYKNKSARDKEMYTRLDLEEKMSKVDKRISDLEDQIKDKELKLTEELGAQDALKKALAQERIAGEVLKAELQKVTDLKNKLEKDLKDALAAAGKTVKKK